MHLSWFELAEVTRQSLPSTETVLLEGFAEKPVPEMVRYCPPMLPLLGLTAVMVGRAVNSKYSLGSKELLLM